ncbi:hypothetical protein SEA_NICEHOUSE_101 [Rhodococcus phage NiceHouse]|nr:hypothetical protein SEA_NICEHOUSE_101 [Rhodococcus phage NiceHouse]
MVARKKRSTRHLEPYWHNKDISIFYELNFNKSVITPGMLIKFKGDRTVYKFTRLVVNSKTGKEWLDVQDTTLGGWRSFYLDRLTGPVYKRSYAKKK